jgi:hypothetical protein
MWIIFSEGFKGSESMSVDNEQITPFKFSLKGQGLGFYQITIPDYKYHDVLDIQVIDPLDKIISDKRIGGKMVVNYFEYDMDGNYVIHVTNLSNRNIQFDIEYGDTNSSELTIPGIITLAGGILLVYATFRKMQNYCISQPEKKI